MIFGGQNSILLELRPILDNIYEPDETASLSIDPGSSYTQGSSSTASVTIRNYSSLQTDQTNLPKWDVAWTNIQAENQASQTFTPGLLAIRSVEIDLLTANQGYGDDTIRLEIWRESSRLVTA